MRYHLSVSHSDCTILHFNEQFTSVLILPRGVFVVAKSLQSCPTLRDLMDYSPLGSSVCGILQARILEGVAMPSCRGSS